MSATRSLTPSRAPGRRSTSGGRKSTLPASRASAAVAAGGGYLVEAVAEG
jgi:hypothetical protein